MALKISLTTNKGRGVGLAGSQLNKVGVTGASELVLFAPAARNNNVT